MHTSPALISFLQKTTLFRGLSAQELAFLTESIIKMTVKKGEFVIRENEVSNQIYFIQEGEVEIIKFDEKAGRFYRLAILGAGDVVGEGALIGHTIRSASVRTTKPCTLLALTLADSQPPTLIKNIAKILIRHMRSANNAMIENLRNELEQTQKRVAVGKLIIYTLSTISLYVLALEITERLPENFLSTSVLNLPLITIFASAVFFMMRKSGHPLSQYGLTLRNWERALFEAIVVSIPLCLGIVIYKWVLIQFIPSFSNSILFDITDVKTHLGISTPIFYLTLLFYCFFAPLEELIVRGALQSSLEELFVGPDKTALAIVLSNLLFGITHMHVSLGMGFLVSMPGLVWGWLYARQRTLVGVSVSHILVGIWTLFVVGFNNF